MAGIAGDEVAQCIVFGSSAPLFVDGRIIVIAGDVRLELGWRKSIGAGGKPEIRTAVYDIEIEGTMVR